MGLKTRLDGRSEINNSLRLLNREGQVIAEITVLGESSTTLDITTMAGIYIDKPSGWESKITEE